MQKRKRKRAKNKTKDSPYYIDNKEFATALHDYVKECDEAKNKGEEIPVITDYIATSILRLAEGLSRAPNFVNYTYREDMVMDAVENCIRVVKNYDITKVTRTGAPNPFSYFTQISYFAFLRRIAQEKKETEIKERLLNSGDLSSFIESDQDSHVGESVVNRVHNNHDRYMGKQREYNDPKQKTTRKKKHTHTDLI